MNKCIQVIKSPVPSQEIQNQLVSEIEKLEIKIEKAQKVLDGISERKNEMIKKYL